MQNVRDGSCLPPLPQKIQLFFLEMLAKRLSVKIKAFINKWVCYEFLALHSPVDSWGAFI